MEFKAKLINGLVEIFPKVESIPNGNGGNDIVVHALNPSAVILAKMEVLNKLARGEKVDLEIINNEVKK